MLKFLKMKLKAGSLASKSLAKLSKAGGAVTTGDGLADTIFGWKMELTPACVPCEEKMSVTLGCVVEDEAAKEGGPRAELVLSCKSDAEAGECLALIKGLMDIVGPSIAEQMMGVLPEFTSDGKNIVITMKPPEGVMEMAVYAQEDMLRIVTPMIKAAKNSGIKVSYANTFDDFLAAPDTPIYETFKGVKYNLLASVTAFGKGMIFNLMNAMMGKTKETGLAIEFAKLFTGGEMNTALGWHRANVKGLVDMLPDPAGDMMSPSSVQAMVGMQFSMMGPTADDLPPEAKDMAKSALSVLKKLDGIESLAVDNFFLPKKFSQNGLDATVNLRATGENMRPFGLALYYLNPCIEQIGIS
jgi:hypothetical protein